MYTLQERNGRWSVTINRTLMKIAKVGPVVFLAKGHAYKIEQNFLGRYIRLNNKSESKTEKNLAISRELQLINNSVERKPKK